MDKSRWKGRVVACLLVSCLVCWCGVFVDRRIFFCVMISQSIIQQTPLWHKRCSDKRMKWNNGPECGCSSVLSRRVYICCLRAQLYVCIALLSSLPAWKCLFLGPLWYFKLYPHPKTQVKGRWICSSATLNTVWDWSDNAICTDRDPHPFCDSCLLGGVKKPHRKCQAKIPAEQMSRWPSGFMWFCLLYVEVLFCCMRRSAVSLGCSEPGWERWREGTAPTHRLYPELRNRHLFFRT